MSFLDRTSALLRSVRAGQIIGDTYRVVSLLGTGAISVVVLVERMSSGEKFAARVFDGEWIRNAPGGLDAFMRDATKLQQIQSTHLMRVMSAGTMKGGTPYLVFEYLEGVDLRRAVAEKEALWIGDAAEFARQACDALSKAHALGLVHRDLRPNNLFLVAGPNDTLRLKVTGFGLGAVADGPHASGEQSTSSLEYASPEMLAGNPVDSRADVWSLGITLYEWVTGARPFDAQTLSTLLAKRGVLTPPKMTSPLGVPIPEAFESVVRKCLEVYPRKRFRDAGELSIALAPFPTMMAPDGVVATIARSPNAPTALGLQSPPNKTLAMNPRESLDVTKALNPPSALTGPARLVDDTLVSEVEQEAPTPLSITNRMGARAIRPAFLAGIESAPESMGSPESKTLIRDVPEILPIALPPVIVVELEGGKGWRVFAGVVAMLILLALPVVYVHFHGRTVPPPPDPDVAQSAANAQDNAPPKSHKRPPRPQIDTSTSVGANH